ncbi:hypothetical protein BKA66DRAFT_475504 [Pyrenochaeta sp. MPI-SDFR-AT-0127]|nr:hypothetical protein BKA66DRAFT_475504 [Pyrenochaeta sp. MPI-SDFR-AT-0127]
MAPELSRSPADTVNFGALNLEERGCSKTEPHDKNHEENAMKHSEVSINHGNSNLTVGGVGTGYINGPANIHVENYGLDVHGRPKSHRISSFDRKQLPNFVDRDEELETLHKVLNRIPAENIPSSCVIWGMAGIGKTWLAYRYRAQKVPENYCAIFLRSSSPDTLEESVDEALRQMSIHPSHELKLHKKVEKLKAWLEDVCFLETACKGWLLVLDDVRDETLQNVKNVIPARANGGKVLITTRSRPIAKDITSVSLAPDINRCYEIKLPGPDWAVSLFSCYYNAQAHEKEKIRDIVEAVGCLPLAVEIAANRASHHTVESVWSERLNAHDWETTITNYDDHPRFRREMILKNAFDFLLDLPNKSRGNEAALFGDLSFLDPTSISISLLDQPLTMSQTFSQKLRSFGAMIPYQMPSILSSSPENISHTINSLERLSLLTQGVNGEQKFIWIHSLVQTISRNDLFNRRISNKHIECVVKRLDTALNFGRDHNGTPPSLIQVKEVSRHVGSLLDWIFELRPPSSEEHALRLLTLRDTIVHIFLEAGRYDDAWSVAQDIYKRRVELHGLDHFQSVKALDLCGTTHRCWGRYAEAEEYHALALKTAEEIEAKRYRRRTVEGKTLLECKESWALLLYCQGRYKDALKEMTDVEQDRRLLFDNYHPTLSGRCHENLCLLYQSCGDYERAKEYVEYVIDPTARAVCHGLLLQKLGKFEDAKKEVGQAFKEQELRFGQKHLLTLRSLHIYASVLIDQGKYVIAEKYMMKVWRERTRRIGKMHPETLSSQSMLAQVHLCQGRDEEARSEALTAFDRQVEVLGRNHPDTLSTLTVLAFIQFRRGNFTEAAKSYESIYEIRRETLDRRKTLTLKARHHPLTLEARADQARMLSLLGDPLGAEQRLRIVQNKQANELGEFHLSTLASASALAWEQFNLGRYTNASETAYVAWVLQEGILGRNHPTVLTCLHQYAVMLRHQGLFQEAEALSKRAWKSRHSAFIAGNLPQPDQSQDDLSKVTHPDILASLDSHSLALYYMGHRKRALKLCSEALKGRRKILGDSHPETLESLDSYSFILLDLDKDAAVQVREALEARKNLPPDHPKWLLSRYNLAAVLFCEGKYAKAEQISNETMEKRAQKLGRNHPDTLSSMHQVGLFHEHAGKFPEAEHFFRDAFTGRKSLLGIVHRDTLASLLHYSNAYSKHCTQSQLRDLIVSELHVQAMSLPRALLEHRDAEYGCLTRIALKVFSEDVSEQIMGGMDDFLRTCRAEVKEFVKGYSNIIIARDYLKQGKGKHAEEELKVLQSSPEVRALVGLALLQQSTVKEAESSISQGFGAGQSCDECVSIVSEETIK